MKDKGDRQFEILDERLLDIQGKLRKRPTTEQVQKIVDEAKQEILDAIAKLEKKHGPPAKISFVKLVFPDLKETL